MISISEAALSLQLGAGIISRAFCGLFQFDRQVNTAQCLPALQPALLRWRRRQSAEHCEKNYTYTCNQSARGAKQYQESYFMFDLLYNWNIFCNLGFIVGVSQSFRLKQTRV